MDLLLARVWGAEYSEPKEQLMCSLRARFILSHVLPLVVVISLVGVALAYLLETQVLLAGLSNELEQQATLVATVATDYPQIWYDSLGAPLSAIQALVGGAEEDPAVRQELLEGMEGEIRRMRHLLDDLSRLYDQTLRPLELDCKPTALYPWLAQVLGPWREAAQDKGLRWRTDLHADLPTLEIDPDWLAQALGNMVSNAIKYTLPGGEICVSAGMGDEEVWIRVRDSGPGMGPEEKVLPAWGAPSRFGCPAGRPAGNAVRLERLPSRLLLSLP